MRVGNGFDVHQLVAGRYLILAGVNIPFEMGLVGHSDGDALTHAIIDALLGAACLGDIGMWFPNDDPQYRGAHSLDLLRAVSQAVQGKGLRISNIDSVIICERPKLSPYFLQMRDNLASALSIETDQISVKATTFEGLGFVGRGEAIACQAVALLQ